MDPTTILADFIHRHRLQGTAGVIAVSGGADSVALAHLLVDALRGGAFPRLILAHVNHKLRGQESDDDQKFVLGLPLLWQVDNATLTCRSVCIDVAEKAKAHRTNLENAARDERYRWFADLAHRENASWVAVGHTEDDQAETVLFRLFRGSGILGLGAMCESRPLSASVELIRPCLGMRRHELRNYLDSNNIQFRNDSSNDDTRFTRNRLRRELLPILERDYNPAVVSVLSRLATQARELHQEVASAASQLLNESELSRAGNILVFSNDRLMNAPRNLLREMFRLVWQREGWPLGKMDYSRWNRLVDVTRGTLRALDFPGNIHARREGSVLQLVISPRHQKDKN